MGGAIGAHDSWVLTLTIALLFLFRPFAWAPSRAIHSQTMAQRAAPIESRLSLDVSRASDRLPTTVRRSPSGSGRTACQRTSSSLPLHVYSCTVAAGRSAHLCHEACAWHMPLPAHRAP